MRGLIEPIVIDLEGDQSGLDLRYWYRDSRFLAGAGESRITQSWRTGYLRTSQQESGDGSGATSV